MPRAERAERKPTEETQAEKRPHLRVVKESPAPVEFAKPEPVELPLSKKEIKALVTKRQELEDMVKAMEVRSKIGGKKGKMNAAERQKVVYDIMKINADLEAGGVDVFQQMQDDRLAEAKEIVKVVAKERKAHAKEKPIEKEATEAPAFKVADVKELVTDVTEKVARRSAAKKEQLRKATETMREQVTEGMEERVDKMLERQDRINAVMTEADRLAADLKSLGVDVEKLAVSGWSRFTLGVREGFDANVKKLRKEYDGKLKELNELAKELSGLGGLSKEARAKRDRTMARIKSRMSPSSSKM